MSAEKKLIMLKVLARSSRGYDSFVCEDDDGTEHHVDLYVDGSLPQTCRQITFPFYVTVEELFPYMETARNVSFCGQEDE